MVLAKRSRTIQRRRRRRRRRRSGKCQPRVKVQKGYGTMPIFRTQPLQRGYGFGGLFRGLLKSIAPMAKRGLLSVGKAALNAGARALEDVRDNNASVKDAFKRQAVDTFNPVNAINRVMRKRKATSRTKQTKGKVARTTATTATKRVKKTRTANSNNRTKARAISDTPRL